MILSIVVTWCFVVSTLFIWTFSTVAVFIFSTQVFQVRVEHWPEWYYPKFVVCFETRQPGRSKMYHQALEKIKSAKAPAPLKHRKLFSEFRKKMLLFSPMEAEVFSIMHIVTPTFIESWDAHSAMFFVFSRTVSEVSILSPITQVFLMDIFLWRFSSRFIGFWLFSGKLVWYHFVTRLSFASNLESILTENLKKKIDDRLIGLRSSPLRSASRVSTVGATCTKIKVSKWCKSATKFRWVRMFSQKSYGILDY